MNNIKVLHIVAGDLSGGAARGAYWLHKGLLKYGIDSRLLGSSSETYGDPTVRSIISHKKGEVLQFLRRGFDYAPLRFYRNKQQLIFSPGLVGYDFTRTHLYKNSDIVHLHWVCHGLVNVRHLAKIKKPIVWTMRDMWPMTGGCHVAEALHCDKYQTICGKCPQLGSNHDLDLSRIGWRRKQKFIPPDITLVGISRWISHCASKSALFRGFDIRTIHNNVNTRAFFPVEKKIARRILGLPEDRPVLLAGARSLNDFYKGFESYIAALRQIHPDIFLLFFGKAVPAEIASLGRNHLDMGFLHDTVSLRLAYSSADVFAAPTHMDAFGKTLVEAMACGTPVVCFDATGPKDIVDHKKNGYKARPFDPADLARGIEWMLKDEDRLAELSKQARKKAVKAFDADVIAGKYKTLYKEIVKKH